MTRNERAVIAAVLREWRQYEAPAPIASVAAGITLDIAARVLPNEERDRFFRATDPQMSLPIDYARKGTR